MFISAFKLPLIIEGRPDEISGRNLKQKPWWGGGGILLVGSHRLRFSLAFLNRPGPPVEGMGPPTVGWTFLQQLTPQTNLIWAIL